MKKRTLLFLSILATISFTSTAENLRESIAIVRPNFSESTQTFLTDFSKSLRKTDSVAADILPMRKKSFGTGFAYRIKRRSVIHHHQPSCVEQAETVDVRIFPTGQQFQNVRDMPRSGCAR